MDDAELLNICTKLRRAILLKQVELWSAGGEIHATFLPHRQDMVIGPDTRKWTGIIDPKGP